jgi:uncharacterized spore protein YtfJ
MDTMTLVEPVRDAVRSNRIFGEPVTAHGVTLVTAARVGSGLGGGSGHGPDGEGEGTGGGGGFRGRPVGAYVLGEGEVRWLPALDVNRLVLVGAAVAVIALLVAGRVARLQSPDGRCLR